MKFINTPIDDLFIIEPEPLTDARGLFERLYCENEMKAINHDGKIVQINLSFTRHKGFVRGMHFQYPPFAETKIIRCIKGSVFDVAVDIRKDSASLLKWHAVNLSAENRRLIYIPAGFAHGFQALEDDCELLYFHTNFFSKDHEGALSYDDPSIGIRWPLPVQGLSERDKNHPLLKNDFRGIVP